MKQCTRCKRSLDISCFYSKKPIKKSHSPITPWCRECYKSYHVEYRGRMKANFPEELKHRERKYHLWTLFKLTTEEADALHRKAGGVCCICNRSKKLVIDHDHRNGKVRGAICQCCNSRIGWLETHGEAISDYLNPVKVAL
jgi:hypothetical protein